MFTSALSKVATAVLVAPLGSLFLTHAVTASKNEVLLSPVYFDACRVVNDTCIPPAPGTPLVVTQGELIAFRSYTLENSTFWDKDANLRSEQLISVATLWNTTDSFSQSEYYPPDRGFCPDLPYSDPSRYCTNTNIDRGTVAAYRKSFAPKPKSEAAVRDGIPFLGLRTYPGRTTVSNAGTFYEIPDFGRPYPEHLMYGEQGREYLYDEPGDVLQILTTNFTVQWLVAAERARTADGATTAASNGTIIIMPNLLAKSFLWNSFNTYSLVSPRQRRAAWPDENTAAARPTAGLLRAMAVILLATVLGGIV
ncbi:uncharacterized protein EV422DRAFT_572178 [Fimicolochytrium jonesii]|uniref:uncharacterized protein n=1 Tax=Fimicolochytrium jonesii TaxID=1396493 RepID=UPI0022FEC81D|nr:uncharacterized protein EV422DRAFT_572178 [Fimicolochytrium jonesii]KAI8816115.1 hypothetical protein EV422DRAFT_572178 [Fimicolochytrium jonesii]